MHDGEALNAEFLGAGYKAKNKSSGPNKPQMVRPHEERHAQAGDMSDELLAMIHTAIPDGMIYKVPGAKDAADAE